MQLPEITKTSMIVMLSDTVRSTIKKETINSAESIPVVSLTIASVKVFIQI